MMTRTLAMWITFVCSFALVATAQDVDPNDDRLAKARADYAKEIERFNSAVESLLDKNEAVARRRGNLDEVNAAKLAKESYSETGKLPEPLPAYVQRSLISANQKISVAYENEIQSLVRSGADAEAELYRKELERLIKGQLKLAGQQIVGITAKNAVGYEVGAVAAGEKLVFRYQGGKWKGWGRGATESPDSEITESKDHCRLAIGFIKDDGRFERLAVVPANTAVTPFQWIAKTSYDKVVLRINDPDGRFDNNPDGGVKYEIAVYRYIRQKAEQ